MKLRENPAFKELLKERRSFAKTIARLEQRLVKYEAKIIALREAEAKKSTKPPVDKYKNEKPPELDTPDPTFRFGVFWKRQTFAISWTVSEDEHTAGKIYLERNDLAGSHREDWTVEKCVAVYVDGKERLVRPVRFARVAY